MIFIINKDILDNMYEVIVYFFNLCLSMMLFLGIIRIKNEGPLNKEENTNDEVNIFL